MRLTDYPHPTPDFGTGAHDSPVNTEVPDNLKQFALSLMAHGVTWYKLLCGEQNKVEMARVLSSHGIEPIARLYVPGPHPNYVVSADDVRAYRDAGVHYFEFGNEPHFAHEWDRPEVPPDGPALVAEQFLRNAEVINSLGGICLLPAVDINERALTFFKSIVTAVTALQETGKPNVLARNAVALHNRPLNHPLDYAVSDFNFSAWRMYELVDDYLVTALGHSIPILGTEAGCVYGQQDDATYPAIGWNLYRDRNMEMFRGFGQGRWREAMFCACIWYWPYSLGDDTWQRESVLNNVVLGGEDTPLAQAMLIEDWQERPLWRQETPMPANDNWDAEREEWIAAGGNPDLDFQIHLAATGRTASTKTLLDQAINNAKARADQIALLAKALPKA